MDDIDSPVPVVGLDPPVIGVDPLDEGSGGVAIRGGALLAGGYTVSILLSLISAPLLVRHLGNDYGIYVTISALTTIVSGTSELGLTSMGVREFSSREPRDRRDLLADLLGARIAFTVVGIAGAMVFAVAAGYDARRLLGTALACASLLALAIQSALTVPLAAGMRQGWIAAADLLRQTVQVALVVALVLAGAGLVPMLATAIPAALAGLLLTLTVSRRALVWPSVHPRRWLGLLRGTLPFAAASAASVIYLRLTIIISSLVATSQQNTDFAVAFRVLEVLINVPSLVVSALFPIMARAAVHDPERLRAGLERTLRTAFGIAVVVAAIVATGAPIAVLLLVGSRPHAVTLALRILGCGLGFSFVGAVTQYALLAMRAHREILVINLVALTLNGVLTALLARSHGAPGAALALACSEVAVAGVSTLFLRRHIPRLRLPLQAAPRCAIVVATALAADLALQSAGAVLAALLTPALVVLAGLLSGAIPRELLEALSIPRRRA